MPPPCSRRQPVPKVREAEAASLVFVIPGRVRAWRAQSAVAAIVATLALVAGLVLPVSAAPNGPTRLSDPQVSPTAAAPGTRITLAVSYRNREGSPPDFVRVVVGGATHQLTPSDGSDDWKSGVRYTMTLTLPLGSYPVRFEAMDRDRFTDAIDAPTITVAHPATPTPAPSTPAPSATPVPTRTPQPSATPQPTATPAPTPRLSASPAATPTPAPARTPTPSPAATRAPTPTARPSSPVAGPSSAAAPGTPGSGPVVTAPPTPSDTGAPASGLPGAGVGGGSSPEPLPSPSAPPSASPVGSAAGAATGGGPDIGGRGRDGPEPGDSSTGGLAGWTPGSGYPFGGGAWDALVRALPTMTTTTAVVTAAMALGLFGKRRRDGEPTAPDEVLHAAAASATVAIATSALVPAAAVPAEPDAHLPRWRRPSLLEARKADPLRQASTSVRLTFESGGAGEGRRERRMIRYRLVRLLDTPDELLGNEIGILDEGDEVVPLVKRGAYWQVLCPDGRQGWIHKMTLGDVVIDAPSVSGGDTWTSGDRGPAQDEIDEDVLRAFLESRRREEPGAI